MTLKITNTGERVLLAYGLTASYYMGLYVSNHTITDSSTLSSFTECSDMDYTSYGGRQYISWGSISTVSGKARSVMVSGISWIFSPNEFRTPFTIYGYFITNDNTVGSTSGELVMGALLSTPQLIDTGTSYTMTIPAQTLRGYQP